MLSLKGFFPLLFILSPPAHTSRHIENINAPLHHHRPLHLLRMVYCFFIYGDAQQCQTVLSLSVSTVIDILRTRFTRRILNSMVDAQKLCVYI